MDPRPQDPWDGVSKNIAVKREAILTAILNSHLVTADERELLAASIKNGIYKIDEGDSKIINASKALLNLMTRIGNLLPLIEPLKAWASAESGWDKFVANARLLKGGYGVKDDILNVFDDYNNLMFYMQQLLAGFGDIASINSSMAELVNELRGTIEGSLSPVVDMLKAIGKQPGPQEVMMVTETVQASLQRNPASNPDSDYITQLREQSYTLLTNLQDYIATNLHRVSQQGYYTIEDNLDPKTKGILLAANSLAHFNESLVKVGKIVDMKSFDILGAIYELSKTFTDLNNALNQGAIASAASVKNIIKQMMELLAPYLEKIVYASEVIQLRSGIKTAAWTVHLDSIVKGYEDIANSLNLPIEDDIFARQRLRARQEEYARVTLEINNLEHARETFKGLNVTDKTSLFTLMALLAEARLVKTPSSVSYCQGLEEIIYRRTGLDKINVEIVRLERQALNRGKNFDDFERLQELYKVRIAAQNKLNDIYNKRDSRAAFHINANFNSLTEGSLFGNEVYLVTQAMAKRLTESIENNSNGVVTGLHPGKLRDQERLARKVITAQNELIMLKSDRLDNDLYVIKNKVDELAWDKLSVLKNSEILVILPMLESLSAELVGPLKRNLIFQHKLNDIHQLESIKNDIQKIISEPHADLFVLSNLLAMNEDQVRELIEGSKKQSWLSIYNYKIVDAINQRIALLEGQLDVDTRETDRQRWPTIHLQARQAINAALLRETGAIDAKQDSVVPPIDLSPNYAELPRDELLSNLNNRYKGPIIITSEKARNIIHGVLLKYVANNSNKASDGHYDISFSDGVLAKNAKAIANTLVSIEKLISFMQRRIEQMPVTSEHGILADIYNYYRFASDSTGELNRLQADLQANINDLLFYIDEVKGLMPQLSPEQQILLRRNLEMILKPIRSFLATMNETNLESVLGPHIARRITDGIALLDENVIAGHSVVSLPFEKLISFIDSEVKRNPNAS